MEATNNPDILTFQLSQIPVAIHLGNSAITYYPVKLTIYTKQPD